ncbi:hypothetical protein D3C72_2067850 [compost metagenome]
MDHFSSRAGCAATEALQTRHGLLHRPTWRGLDDGEIDQQDCQQRRDDQQQTAQDISGHGEAFRRSAICALVSGVGLTSHQVSRPSS